ncbi:putative benzoate transporter [Escherichia coli]|uniref:Putative benzoate transporter n=1 Tax=Escherichia coli TaxID=562 RepID=A0A377A1A5_ECOLX|nr:putative benzoate transporter [Escherichia coli]
MTALGLAMGVSTLTLTLWYRVPVLTAWSTPGAALLVTGLQGLTLNEAIGVFIFTNALIVLCGITGLFARLMRIIPHSLAAAMLAGILLRFGLQAFASLDGQFTLCGKYVAGMAGNQGRCAALCGNCRDDYWDRDRYRAR